MSKRRYKSEEFKKVDWDQVDSRIEGERVVLSVDVAKEDFVATVLDCGPEAVLTFKWSHPQETAAVIERMRWLEQDRRMDVVLEPSGTYGDALIWQLRQAGIALYRVSPKRVHDAAEVYDGVPSLHDAKAAYVIGRLHLQGVSQPWQESSEGRRELKAILSELGVYKERLHGARSRLEAHLSRHWPEIVSILGLDSVTLATLVRTYGDAAAVGADPDRVAALMHRSGGAGLSEEKIQGVLASARTSLGVPCLQAERELLQWLGADILEARRHVRQLEQEIARRVERTPALARMGALIGKVSAAVLLTAVGPPRDYPDAGSYLKALGLNLKERSSGKHKGQLKITKRGPSLARFYLYFAALRLIAADPLVKRWFTLKSGRPGALKKKCVIELMRKLAKALWHIARGGEFDAAKLFNPKALARV